MYDGRERPPSGDNRGEKRLRTNDIRNKNSLYEVIVTIHITGLPQDAKERDLRNLLVFLNGFEGCSIHNSPDQVYGFARFCDTQSAENAIGMLNGLNFDLDDADSAIRATMAKRNLTLHRDQLDRHRHPNHRRSFSVMNNGFVEAQQQNHVFNGYSDFPAGGGAMAMGSNGQMNGMGSLNGNQLALNGNQLEMMGGGSGQYGGYQPVTGGYGSFSQITRQPVKDLNYDSMSYHQSNQHGQRMPYQSRRETSGGNRGLPSRANSQRQPMANPDPCDTICVRGFSPFMTQADATEIMSKLEGFQTMNYVVKGSGSPIAFVAFDSINSSTNAMDQLQGTTVPNHEGSLFVQFARRSCAKH